MLNRCLVCGQMSPERAISSDRHHPLTLNPTHDIGSPDDAAEPGYFSSNLVRLFLDLKMRTVHSVALFVGVV